MKTFEDLKFIQHKNFADGKQAVMMFENGFGVSVVRFRSLPGGSFSSYTSDETEWEVAIMYGTNEDYAITYNSGITDDVIGHAKAEDVTEIMKKVQQLPKDVTA